MEGERQKNDDVNKMTTIRRKLKTNNKTNVIPKHF